MKSRFTTVRMPAQVSSAGPAGGGKPHSRSDGGGGEEKSSASYAAVGAVAGLETGRDGESSGGATGKHPSQQKDDGDSQPAEAVAVKVCLRDRVGHDSGWRCRESSRRRDA